MKLAEFHKPLNERARELTPKERALLRKNINDMTDEEKALRAKIDSEDWDENAAAVSDRYGKHDTVTDFEDDSNFSGKNKEKHYRLKRGMNVFVYRNLNVTTIDPRFHEHQVIWSLRANKSYSTGDGDDISSGNVIHHAINVALENAFFVVHEGREGKYGKHTEIVWDEAGNIVSTKSVPADSGSGWRGVRSSGQKNVHAGVIGDLQSWGKVAIPPFKELMESDEWQILTYDPYKYTQFQIVDKTTLGPGKTMKVVGEAHEADMVLMGNMVSNVLGVLKVQRPLVIGKNVR